MESKNLPTPPTPPNTDPSDENINLVTPLNNPSALTYNSKPSEETIDQALKQAQDKKLINTHQEAHPLAEKPAANTPNRPDHPIHQTYKGIVTAIVFLSVSSLAIFITTSFLTTTNTAPTTISADYYQQLYNQCRQTANIACCRESVRTIEQNNFQISEGSCPAGTQVNTLGCPTSMQWCEPLLQPEQ